MGGAERRKGRSGEAEVAAIFRGWGFTVRGLEGGGDHLLAVKPSTTAVDVPPLHSEVKRCETARPWLWIAQAEAEAPPGALPVVSFRRNRSRWYSIVATDDLARILGGGTVQP